MDTGGVRERLDILGGLSRSYLFEDLTRDQLAPLAATATTRELVKDEYLWRSGAPADEIYVVLSGEVKDTVADADGFEIIHFMHGPGMTVGEPGYFAVERNRIVEVVAMTPSVLIRLERRHLGPFMAQHPSTKDRALERLASNTRSQTMMLVSALRRSLPDRIGLRLLELVEENAQHPGGAAVTPKISQSTLAGMVGVSRENVNRALASLVADGLVRLENGRYVIPDEPALRERISRDWPLSQRRDRRQM